MCSLGKFNGDLDFTPNFAQKFSQDFVMAHELQSRS
jgi:hypothetical protein